MNLKRQTTLELESGDTILLRDITEFAEGKPLQLELEPATLVQARDSTIENVENYPHVEFIDGNAYMVAGHLDISKDLWEIEDGKLKKKDSKILLNKLSTSRIRHPCPREGCSKVYSTPHHLKVKILPNIIANYKLIQVSSQRQCELIAISILSESCS